MDKSKLIGMVYFLNLIMRVFRDNICNVFGGFVRDFIVPIMLKFPDNKVLCVRTLRENYNAYFNVISMPADIDLHIPSFKKGMLKELNSFDITLENIISDTQNYNVIKYRVNLAFPKSSFEIDIVKSRTLSEMPFDCDVNALVYSLQDKRLTHRTITLDIIQSYKMIENTQNKKCVFPEFGEFMYGFTANFQKQRIGRIFKMLRKGYVILNYKFICYNKYHFDICGMCREIKELEFGFGCAPSHGLCDECMMTYLIDAIGKNFVSCPHCRKSIKFNS
jgi:hypothetical protein